MKTAIITGASSGLGEQFALQLHESFPDIECVWLIARRRDKLTELARRLRGVKRVLVLPLDLCAEDSFDVLSSRLEREGADVGLLINNAGCGVLGNVGEVATQSQTHMTDLNVRALTAVTNIVLPYMGAGAHIINVSSIASFCANARMTVYSSTKAYVTSFTYGLAEELRERGVGVTAVCPGPMDTEFIGRAGITGNSKMFEQLPYCDPERVVAGTYAAAKAGKTVYTPTAFFKFYRFLAKVLPESLVTRIAKT